MRFTVGLHGVWSAAAAMFLFARSMRLFAAYSASLEVLYSDLPTSGSDSLLPCPLSSSPGKFISNVLTLACAERNCIGKK